MNNVLAIDASTSLLSICLKTGDKYYELTLDCGLKHMENVLIQTDHLIKTADISPEDLELLVCSEGPGILYRTSNCHVQQSKAWELH